MEIKMTKDRAYLLAKLMLPILLPLIIIEIFWHWLEIQIERLS